MLDSWIEIVDNGWAPEYLGGTILWYVRRKEVVPAAWHYDRLVEMCRGQLLPANCVKASARQRHVGRANAVAVKLKELLTEEERERLGRVMI